jgi:peptidylprolyl isomerase
MREMNLNPVRLAAPLLAFCALSLAAQQVHHSNTAAHRPAPATPAAAEGPVLPPGVPPATGKLETAFALRYIDIKQGDGPVAEPGEFLTVQYTGWLGSDGTKFDSSLDRPDPFTFRLGGDPVIQGWVHGFQGMHVGGKRRLFIPYQLAYGERGRPPVIQPKSDLIFDIELVAAGDTPPPPPQPPTTEPPAPPSTPPAGQQGAAPQPQ